MINITRMHSCRMRTARFSGRLLGVSARGGVCLGGVFALGVGGGASA